MIEPFNFPSRSLFVNRSDDLDHLEEWWSGRSLDPVCLFGRRRVGKSWLFRAFAHGKPAIILVADERALQPQLRRFSDTFEELIGLRPELDDVAALVRAAYRLGRDQKILVVIDEFPLLLGAGKKRKEQLTAIAAVMEEERDSSQTKLVFCGSLIAQMESLLAQDSPLHGRLRPLDIRPMSFAEAQSLLAPGETAQQCIERYSVAGGMARYLAELGAPGSLRNLVCRNALDRRGSLFRDPRDVLERELREPAVYFSILEELALGEAGLDHLAKALGHKSTSLTAYLDTLHQMRLVSVHLPAGAGKDSRKRKYRLEDGFIRFWFRFVFPHQDDLESGLSPQDLWDGEVREFLSDHTAQTFEDICRQYTRRIYGREAPAVSGWWGDALNEFSERSQEEIDIVGLQRRRLNIVGECKWTTSPMPVSVLDDLRTYKIPAIIHKQNLKPPKDGPKILLFCRSDFSPALKRAAGDDAQVELVTCDQLLSAFSDARQ